MTEAAASRSPRATSPGAEPIRSHASSAGSLAYHAAGDPGGPLVVLQHGFPDFPKTFFPVMERLIARGYRCVAPFLRGYSPSTADGPFHAARLGDDLVELAQALSPDAQAILVGHDWGAVATYAALERRPGLFRRAVTLSVPHVAAFQKNVLGSAGQQRRSAYMAFFMLPLVPERVVPARDFAFVDALYRSWSPGFFPDPQYLRELKRCLEDSMPGPFGPYRALRPGGWGASPRIEVPVLHLHGARDGCIAFDAGRGQERFFAAEFESENLPGVGHFLHLEDPERIATKILRFIER